MRHRPVGTLAAQDTPRPRRGPVEHGDQRPPLHAAGRAGYRRAATHRRRDRAQPARRVGYDIALHYRDSAEEAQALASRTGERPRSGEARLLLQSLDRIPTIHRFPCPNWSRSRPDASAASSALVNNASAFTPTPIGTRDAGATGRAVRPCNARARRSSWRGGGAAPARDDAARSSTSPILRRTPCFASTRSTAVAKAAAA